jgi:hypothetical protein
MFWLMFCLLTALYLAISYWKRPQLAIGVVMVCAFLLPTWVNIPLFDTTDGSIVGAGIDLKFAVGTVALALYSFLPRRTFPLKLVLCDYLMLAMMSIHALRDFTASGFELYTIGLVYGEWYVPYLCGRLALQSKADALELWRWIVPIAGVVGLMACFEAVTSKNLYEVVFGMRPREGASQFAMRWGIKRAYGNCMHPIYHGVVLLLMMGWCITSIREMKVNGASKWYLLAIGAVALGIIATGSRGPIFGMLILVYFMMTYFMLQYRKILIALGVITLVASFSFREEVFGVLEDWSGENRKAKKQKVLNIDSEEVQQSSVRSRVNAFKVYGVALSRAGLIGFGSAKSAGFPPVNLPLGARDAETLKNSRSIENQYLIFILRFGFLGASIFAATGIVAVTQFYKTASRYPGRYVGSLAAVLGSTLGSAMVVIGTVWMPPDIEFPLLWTFGASSGLFVAHQLRNLEEARKTRSTSSRTRRQYTPATQSD